MRRPPLPSAANTLRCTPLWPVGAWPRARMLVRGCCQRRRDKVRLLSEFAQQRPLADSDVLAVGGLALLPRAMSLCLRSELASLRQVADMPRPSVSDASPAAATRWDTCVRVGMLGAAGLVRYLIDAYPPDLPEYDPL